MASPARRSWATGAWRSSSTSRHSPARAGKPAASTSFAHFNPIHDGRSNMRLNRFARPAIVALFAALAAAASADEIGVTQNEIAIGMTNALSGPASGLGTQLKAGASAYINKVNA